tara:strand:+ start:558 stop:1382 length:825 start_codon:yes stop_codon:yes gene_type:complete
MSANTPLYTEITPPQAWQRTEPKKAHRGGYMSYVNNPKLEFQVGEVDGTKYCAPFGHSRGAPPGIECDENKRIIEFNVPTGTHLHGWLQAVDKTNVDFMYKNCDKFFGKTLTMESIEDKYVPCLIKSTDPRYDDRWRIKYIVDDVVDEKSGRILVSKTNFYAFYPNTTGGTSKMTPITHEFFTKGTNAVYKLTSSGLWVVSNRFGNAYTATDILTFPKMGRQPGQFNFGTLAKPTLTTDTAAPYVDTPYVDPLGDAAISSMEGVVANGDTSYVM